ncbi:hypothetical protein GCM10009574_019070 [Streptomyces asiaticus]|uniref:Uncharacterized protein n=1 Tax=Streptomyces rhizosphaericus TaxID=114699 RepID=A0ABN1NRG1_9ACTN
MRIRDALSSNRHLFTQYGGGRDEEAADLVHRLSAGLDGAAARDPQDPDRLDQTVPALGNAGGPPGQHGHRGGVGVDRIGFALHPPRLAVGAVDVDDRDAGGGQHPGEFGPVGAGALHAHRDELAV